MSRTLQFRRYANTDLTSITGADGELIIDEYFLSFHNKEEDWHTPRHQCKIDWGMKVFTTFRSLQDISFI